MCDQKKEDTYQGKKIEDMTRDELIDAVKTLGKLYTDHLTESIHQWGLIADLYK